MRNTFTNISIVLVLLIAMTGCITRSPEKAQYTDISIQQGKEMIDRDEVFILDVRTRDEYDAGHIRGSTLIPLQELNKRLDEVPRDKKILVYCMTGHRSTAASEMLVNNGFTQIYNMKDGIAGWTKAGYEVIK